MGCGDVEVDVEVGGESGGVDCVVGSEGWSGRELGELDDAAAGAGVSAGGGNRAKKRRSRGWRVFASLMCRVDVAMLTCGESGELEDVKNGWLLVVGGSEVIE